ncbi:hypothetical protein DH2020_048499 [Rehmannia glutinosa]|uniref:BHLH domain-containing protein n=1 Tax=Rehmannia glutinosa TaxID=99300 RepID=A0ABR0U5S7_REHGL
MFNPLQPNNNDTQNFRVPTPSIPQQRDLLIPHDGIKSHGFLGNSISGVQDQKKKGKNDDEVINVKKFVHREIERQRRQEMANLSGSLRTLLPPQYIKIGNSKNSKLDNLSNFTVTVNHFPDGVEILIETEFEAKQGFPPSRILRELLQRGFNIVSCVSTRTDEKRSLHRIQLEASNLTFKDLSGLQERLTHVMNCTNGSC